MAWRGYELGMTDPKDVDGNIVPGGMVWQIQDKLKRKYASYTGAVVVSGRYDGATFTAVGEFQKRAGLIGNGVKPDEVGIANYATLVRMGVVTTTPPRAPLTIFTAAGTWSDMWTGFQADVARDLDRRYFFWQPIWYPASFGPVGGGPAPSYEESVALGVEEGIRLIKATPGQFALCGYSQGAEVVARILIELVSGRLGDRLKDCLWFVAFGNPARQPGVCVGRDPGGSGISGIRFAVPASVTVLDYAIDGDMYCTTPDGTEGGTNMRAVYKALTKMQIHDPGRDIISALTGDPSLMRQLIKLFGDPIKGGIGLVDALFRLAKFAITGAHGRYWEYEVFPGVTPVRHAIETLNADAARLLAA
ncbi:putative peptidoglycan-binding domain-containing protein [Mycobacteroides abscessus subsp. abscessus]|nr:putative peptidoglycan-binding domain-containing protein [Mycobacteroides abscessus subsp. abscessus]SLC38173.1 putative peptidoglycan-binding domain-containing protein [Mycobacteroides abscessus subsp. abscessus]